MHDLMVLIIRGPGDPRDAFLRLNHATWSVLRYCIGRCLIYRLKLRSLYFDIDSLEL